MQWKDSGRRRRRRAGEGKEVTTMMERWEVEEWVAVEGKVLHDEVMRMSGRTRRDGCGGCAMK